MIVRNRVQVYDERGMPTISEVQTITLRPTSMLARPQVIVTQGMIDRLPEGVVMVDDNAEDCIICMARFQRGN